MDAKHLMKALRARLGLTQDQFAERADLLRTEINKIEGGHNKVTTLHILRALAQGAGSSLEDMADYFDGTLALDDLWRRIQTRGRAQAANAPTDPYPNRTLAADICRRSGRISDDAIDEVMAELSPPSTRSTFDWIKIFEAAEVRIHSSAPQSPPPHASTRRGRRLSDRPPSSKPATKRGPRSA